MNYMKLLCGVLFLTVTMWAQSPAATLLGRIKDASGAAVPEASVGAVQKGTGAVRTMSTDGEGSYIFSGLPIGTYTLKVEHAGFRSAEIQGIALTTGQVRRVDVSLELGQVTQEIRVSAEGNALNTDDSTVGSLVDSHRVLEMPLNGRDFKQLAYLTPGVIRGASSVASSTFTVNGQRDLQNNFMLDGSPMSGTEQNTPAFTPSIEAIEEFQIKSVNYPASEGWQSGGQVSIALKAGGNSLHGSFFEFNRNDAVAARNFFATSTPFLNRNQFGAVLSGPIRKNRLFFMFDYEGLRQNQTSTGSLTVPTATLRSGNLSSISTQIVDPLSGSIFPSNQIPSSRIVTQAQQLLNYYPLPNNSSASSNYRVNSPSVSDDDQYFGRLDYQISSKDRLYGRVAREFAYTSTGATNPNFSGQITPTTTSILLAEQHIFSPNALNDLRASFFRAPILRSNGRSYSDWNTARDLGINGILVTDPLFIGVPIIGISGYSGLSEVYAPYLQMDEIFQLRDDLTIHHGRHTLSAGFDVRKIRADRILGVYERGSISFDGRWSGDAFADFLLGYPSQTYRGTNPAAMRVRRAAFAGYFQDDWKITPNLTLNIGLRYELQTVPYDHSGGLVQFDPATGTQFGAYTKNKLWSGDHNNFAPRFGFAWRPFHSRNDVVIRGGYGIYYNYAPLIGYIDLGLNPPFYSYQYLNTDKTKAPVLTLENPFSGTVTSSGSALGKSIFSVDPNQRTAYAQNWTLSLQKSLPWNTVVEGAYIGSSTLGLDTGYNYNAPFTPGPTAISTRLPYPDYGIIYLYNTPVGRSNYNALQLSLRRAWNNGLTLQTNYTWAKALGDAFVSGFAGASAEQGYQNVRDRRSDYSRTGLDIRQRFTTSYIYELPFVKMLGNASGLTRRLVDGWQLSGTLQVQSGDPFGVCIDGDIPNVGTIAGNGGCIRPDRIASGKLDNSAISQWFDTSAFVRQADYSYGNAGRNILTGPGDVNVDLALAKSTNIAERHRVQLRVEFFNLINHANFSNPSATYRSTGKTYAATGTITGASSARQIQFGLKYMF